jgi:periplasmic divalent cation tolerance protein
MSTEDSILPEDSIVVLVTLPSLDLAQQLAMSLVDGRFAACVTILPQVQSVYRWKGAVCNEPEVLCLAKTRRQLFDSLREHVLAIHPYEVPEIIALPMVQGHLPYLSWIFTETRNP